MYPVPLTAAHLDGAAARLARRQGGWRQVEAAIARDYTDPASVRPQLEPPSA